MFISDLFEKEKSVEGIFHFQPAKKPAPKPTPSVADMRQHFAKDKNAPLPNVILDKDPKNVQQVYTRPADESQDEIVDELSSDTLSSYKQKARKSADELAAAGKHRQATDRMGNVMRATGKQIDKTSAAIRKSLQGVAEAGTRDGALNSCIQLYKEIQNSHNKPQHETDLLKRQLSALMRKYNITEKEILDAVNAERASQEPPKAQPNQSPNNNRRNFLKKVGIDLASIGIATAAFSGAEAVYDYIKKYVQSKDNFQQKNTRSSWQNNINPTEPASQKSTVNPSKNNTSNQNTTNSEDAKIKENLRQQLIDEVIAPNGPIMPAIATAVSMSTTSKTDPLYKNYTSLMSLLKYFTTFMPGIPEHYNNIKLMSEGQYTVLDVPRAMWINNSPEIIKKLSNYKDYIESYSVKDFDPDEFLKQTDPVTYKEGVAEGSEQSQPSFNIFSRDNYETSFEVELAVDGREAGFFAYQYFPETNDVENDAMIHSDVRGLGHGKILLIKAIETAENHNLPFKIDRNGITPAQRHVYTSLLNDRIIRMNPDKTITLTGKQLAEGEFTISDDPSAHIKLLFLKTINGNEYRLVKQGNVYKIYVNRSTKNKQVFPSFDLAKKALYQLLLNAVHGGKQGVAEDSQQTPQMQQASQALQRGLAAVQKQYPNTDHAFVTRVIKQIQPDGTVVVAGDNYGSADKIKTLLARGGGAQFKVVTTNELEIAKQKPPVAKVSEGPEDADNECYTCRGTGEGLTDNTSCRVCHGTGIAPRQRDDDDFIEPWELHYGDDDFIREQSVDEDAWTGADNQWHSDQGDAWAGSNNQWHEDIEQESIFGFQSPKKKPKINYSDVKNLVSKDRPLQPPHGEVYHGIKDYETQMAEKKRRAKLGLGAAEVQKNKAVRPDHDADQAAWHLAENTAVECRYYVYNRRDQRVLATRVFSSESAARDWAERHNATILDCRPARQTEDSNMPVAVDSTSPVGGHIKEDYDSLLDSMLLEMRQAGYEV